VIDEVVAPSLHNKEPVRSLLSMWSFHNYQPRIQWVLMEFLSEQLHRCLKDWVHPFTVWVTVYVPVVVTVIDEVVAPLLHNKEPV
jgi:hypothetical protein